MDLILERREWGMSVEGGGYAISVSILPGRKLPALLVSEKGMGGYIPVAYFKHEEDRELFERVFLGMISARRTCTNANDPEETGITDFRCSECDRWTFHPNPKYCANCGARIVDGTRTEPPT